MAYLIVVPLVPLLFWLSLGIIFTMLNYIQWLTQQETIMTILTRPARLIRYTDLGSEGMPHLLSTYDEEKNLLRIDRHLAEILPTDMRNRLEMTELPLTRVVDDGHGLRFGSYDTPHTKVTQKVNVWN